MVHLLLTVASILFSKIEKRNIKEKEKKKILYDYPPIGSEIKENIFYPLMSPNNYFVNDILLSKSHYYIPVVESSIFCQ